MFGVKIQGRLGNQLFQYAYAKVLSKQFNTSFFFLNAKEFYIQKYFDLDVKSVAQYRLQAVLFWLKNRLFVKRIEEDQTKSPEWNMQHECDNAFYIGFYQSEQYHKNEIKVELEKEFQVKPNYRINIKDYVANPHKPNIVVHVRRTDYVTWGGEHLGGVNLTLPLQYYKYALELLPKEECNLLFLSDDMAFVKEHFDFPNAIYANKNSEIVDFQLIMQADYLVLANSSFSWWGAYLNKNVKKVIAPKYWLGIKLNREYPAGIVNEGWVTIE